MINLDVEPQNVLLDNLSNGLQILATIDMDRLLDKVVLEGRSAVAQKLGEQLLKLLEVETSLCSGLRPDNYIKELKEKLNLA